ncbi:MAG TPA: phosphonate C-P lyase system protein PhnL [Candidatus Methylomirabilis sp.]|nr:phosphonate C-P lyase system protein PhnL [Candidatus Methylomirabilis sp.]
MSDRAAIEVRDLEKTFTLHVQGGVRLPVLRRVSLAVCPGECVVLTDPSGSGKSTLLRAVYGNYVAQAGRILVRHGARMVDIAGAEPRLVLEVRRQSLGYVSQFLRVIPRVPAVDVVAEPLRSLGTPRAEAVERARRMLERLGIPERLWSLSPVTFSGGEQQRVNIARVFAVDYPILLLDEPTASLDSASRVAVVELIREARRRGAAILGTVHDADIRAAVATRVLTLASAEAA